MKWNIEKREEFLRAIEAGANVKKAASLIGMAVSGLYRIREQDPSFDRDWKEASRLGDMAKLLEIEEEMDRRGIEGTLRPVYYQGAVCGAVREYSDTLLIVRAKSIGPEKYSERYQLNATAHSTLTVRMAPDYDLFRNAILSALRPYPEAQRAVAAAMISLEQRAIEGDTEANGASPPHS